MNANQIHVSSRFRPTENGSYMAIFAFPEEFKPSSAYSPNMSCPYWCFDVMGNFTDQQGQSS